MAALKLPRLGVLTLTDGNGQSTRELSRYWDEFASQIEDAINRIATVEGDVLTINAGLDSLSAEGLFSVVQGTTTGGAQATIELLVRAGIAEAFRTASIKLSALAGTASQIELNADTIVLNGTVLSGGALTTGMLGSGAATTHTKTDFAGVVAVADTAWHTLTAGTAANYTGSPVEIDISCQADCTAASTKAISIRILLDGSVIKTFEGAAGHGMAVFQPVLNPFALSWHDTPTAGTHTYSLQFRNPLTATTEYTVDGTLRVDEIKR